MQTISERKTMQAASDKRYPNCQGHVDGLEFLLRSGGDSQLHTGVTKKTFKKLKLLLSFNATTVIYYNYNRGLVSALLTP